jgi:hypothetical protein
MTTQTSLSAASRATPASPEKCASNSSFESPASSLQNLIANLELEFRSTHRKLNPLKISNRKKIAILQFAAEPLHRPASPSLHSEASVNPPPLVYPELRRAPPHPRDCFESFVQCLRATDRGSRATELPSPPWRLITSGELIAPLARTRADVPQDTRLFLHLDLIRIAGHDLRDFQVARDFAGHAQVFIAIQVFRPAEFRTVTPPDDQRKDLIRILFVKVDKRRLAFAARDEMDAHHSPAHGDLFSYVIFRFSRGDALRLRQRGGCQQQECDKNRGSKLSQRFAFRIPISATSRQHGRRDLAHCKCLNRQSKRQTLGWCGKRSSKGFRRVRPSGAILIYGTAIRNPRKTLKT